MHRVSLTGLVLVALAGSAAAADIPVRMPVKAPVPVVIAPSWAGLYVGAQVGYSWGKDDLCQSFSGVVFANSCRDLGANGIVGGVHAGYNWQMGRTVLGLEADVEATDRSQSDSWGGPTGYGYAFKSNWQMSLRARAGYAFERTLLYVTGGMAYAPSKYSYTALLDAVTIQFSDNRIGWTIGGGIEYAMTGQWSARVEYRYTDWGSATDTAPIGVTPRFDGVSYHHDRTDQTIRAGVSYHFQPAAVVARY